MKEVLIKKVPQGTIMPEILKQVMDLQVQNHYSSKQKAEIKKEGAGIFLFNLKELEEISNQGLMSVALIKEDGIFTQKVVGYAMAVPTNMVIKNSFFNKTFEERCKKFYQEKGLEGDLLITDCFLSKNERVARNSEDFVGNKLIQSLSESIRENYKKAQVFCPIEAISKNYRFYFRKYKLTFGMNPKLIYVNDSECRVVYIGHKELEAV